MKLLEKMSVPDNAPAEQARQAMEKYSTDMAALLKRKCPLDPNEWNPSMKPKPTAIEQP